MSTVFCHFKHCPGQVHPASLVPKGPIKYMEPLEGVDASVEKFCMTAYAYRHSAAAVVMTDVDLCVGGVESKFDLWSVDKFYLVSHGLVYTLEGV